MQILHVIDSLDPKLGGPPMIAYRLAAAQALRGHDVTLVSYESPEATDRIRKAYDRVPASPNLHLQTFPRGGRLEKLFARGARKRLRTLVANADVVHLHSIWEPILVAAATESRRQRKPYFVLLNGMLDPWSLSQRALKKKIALALVYRRMLNGAAALQLGNADEGKLIQPLKLAAPGVIIPNGVFFEEIEPLPASGTFRAQHPELGDKPYILFLSRLHYKKGLDILADAFVPVAQHHPDVQLVVAGPDEGAQDDFRDRIAKSNLTPRVHKVGPLYGDTKFAAIVDAFCFCLPSRQEGFSVAVLESLGSGTPAVITTACHFDDVESTGAGRVVDVDAKQIGAALTGMLADPSKRDAMSANARELIREHYTWQNIGSLAVTAYEKSIKNPVRRKRRVLKTLLLALLLFIVLVEVIGRCFGLCDPPLLQVDSELEYILQPNQNCRQFGNRIIINEYSMRAHDFPRKKSQPNEFRVLVIGDSVAYGGSMVDQDDLATSRLEKSLAASMHRPVVVGNVSAGSWGPPNQLVYVRRQGWFDADVVVIVISQQDYDDAMTFDPFVGVDPSFPDRKPKSAWWEIATRYLPRYLAIKQQAAMGVNAPTARQPVRPENIAAAMGAFDQLVRAAKATGARVIVAQHYQVPEITNGPYPEEAIIADIAKKAGGEVIELGAAMKKSSERGGEGLYRDFIHPSAAGQRIIADVLHEAIVSKPPA